MRFIPVFLVLLFFIVAGCLETSPYKDVSPSQLVSNPGDFEGKKVCINGVIEPTDIGDGRISDIFIGKTMNTSFKKERVFSDFGVLAEVCGTYGRFKIEPDFVDVIMSVSTEKREFYSNEKMKVHVDFNSTSAGKAQIRVSGIKNQFGRALINETKEAYITNGDNEFDFEFTTPSCEECSALSPGVYSINATVNIDGNTFETYKKIVLEREGSNVSEAQAGANATQNALTYNYTQTANVVTVEYFYIPGCQKCEKATPVVETVMKSYGGRVNFLEYNANEEGRELAIKYRIPGTPSVVINAEKLISYENYGGDITKLEALLKEAIDKASAPAANASTGKIVLSVPSVLVVGFLAGFNPCLLAILAFIASVTLATTGRRRNVLLIVLMFSLGIFVTYLTVGIGILRIFEQTPALQTTIRNILVVVIGFLGLWHVYDAYHLRKSTESSFYTPKAFIRLTESVTKKVSLPASFFIGALFSLIKAPCVGAVYFVILDMVRSGEGAGFVYLAAYNLGVVLPVLMLGTAIAFGLNPEKVEKFRKEKRALLRLITGATLLIIAALMYAGII